MADEQEDTLTLDVGDSTNGVSVGDYTDFLQNAVATLQELDKESSQFGSETIDWRIVSVGVGSPLYATIRGRASSPKDEGRAKSIVADFVSGIDQLNRGHKRAPKGFSEPALRHLAKMASYVRRLSPTVRSANKRIELNEDLASNADNAIKVIGVERHRYKEFGSLRGTLKSVAAVREKTDKVMLLERLSGEEIPCYFHNKDIEDEVRKGWKHRVELTGDIYSDRATGKRNRMVIKEIRILPQRGELPQLEDLRGIDITGGVESSEYVRGLRDDD